MEPPSDGTRYYPRLRAGTLAGIAAGVAALVAFLRYRPFRVEIQGPSMAPTLEAGDWAVATAGGRVRVGDVVVLVHPAHGDLEMVKRVRCVPGEVAPDGTTLGPDACSDGVTKVRSAKYPSAVRATTDAGQIELAVRLRLAITRLTRMLRQREDGAVSSAALSALATLEREGALSLGDLAAREHVQPPTMTRIAQGLVEAGLVRRLEDGTDRRVTRVRITQAGMKALARSRRRKEELLATRLRELSARELATLDDAARILDRLTGGEP